MNQITISPPQLSSRIFAYVSISKDRPPAGRHNSPVQGQAKWQDFLDSHRKHLIAVVVVVVVVIDASLFNNHNNYY